jgi:hypothetical protein
LKEGKIEEIVVQRQSSDVSGKAQFVQFGEKDMSMENKIYIGKAACLKHFASKIGPNTICDIVNCIIVAIRSQSTKVSRGHHIGGLIDIYIYILNYQLPIFNIQYN